MKLRQLIKDPPQDYSKLYEKMLKKVAEEKGGETYQYRNLLNKIGFMESNLDAKAKQFSGGPGRGKYQMETGIGYERNEGEKGSFKGTSNRTYHSAKRAKKYLDNIGEKTPEYIQKIIDNETGDVSLLSESQQDVLALGDLRMGRVNLKDYAEGRLSGKDIYLNNWWAGKDEERRELLSNRWDEKEGDFRKTSHYVNAEKQPSKKYLDYPTQQKDNIPNGQVTYANIDTEKEPKNLTEKDTREIFKKEQQNQVQQKESAFINHFKQQTQPQQEYQPQAQDLGFQYDIVDINNFAEGGKYKVKQGDNIKYIFNKKLTKYGI